MISNNYYKMLGLFVLCCLAVSPCQANVPVRIKDMAKVQMGAEVSLTGVGLVIGLEGTGDGRRAEFTFQMLSNYLAHNKIAVTPDQARVNNIAGVNVRAKLSPFARKHSKIDVYIESIGDASTLQGGSLVRTYLEGPDKKIYVLAEGPVSIGGFNLGGGGAGSVQKNHTVAGRIPNGGQVIEEVEKLEDLESDLTLMLYEADWTTASRVAHAIDLFFGERDLATASDPQSVTIKVPPYFEGGDLVEFIADIEKIKVVPDLPARVVVNEKTGTVVVGDHVSVSAVALSHGSLKLKIPGEASTDLFGGGAEVEEEPDHLHPIINSFNVGAMPTVRELVRSLNALGVTPRDMISILQALKTLGALRAELIIQ